MSQPDDLPQLSPAMLADLEALSRGEPLPPIDWTEYPWRKGQPVWAVLLTPGGSVHIYPCRLTEFDLQNGSLMPGHYEPTITVAPDPLSDWAMPLPQGTYKLRRLIRREVRGEEW